MRRDVFYPFPFYFAHQVESNPKIAARADKDLWASFMDLRQACLKFVLPDCDNTLLQTNKDLAKAELNATFQANNGFFKELKPKLESKMENAEIQKWIEGQKSVNNTYPFYTQPLVLELLGLTVAVDKLRPFSETVTACESLLKAKGLEKYISEKPDPHNETVNILMHAMGQLKNIAKLQDLIKNQIA